MGERDGYTPALFAGRNSRPSDQAAAKAFYGALFGWEADDRPVGEGYFYSMQSIDGKHVAAIAAQPHQQREAGVPPLWNSYVWVDTPTRSPSARGSSARRCTRRRST